MVSTLPPTHSPTLSGISLCSRQRSLGLVCSSLVYAICIYLYTDLLLGLVGMSLCPMTSDLFSSSKPNIVVSRKMLDDSLQSHETPWSTDPSSVEGDSDIRRFAF